MKEMIKAFLLLSVFLMAGMMVTSCGDEPEAEPDKDKPWHDQDTGQNPGSQEPGVEDPDEEDENGNFQLTLNMTSLSMKYKNEFQLQTEEKNVEWESMNPFVASVDNNGKVTANHVGVTTIILRKGEKTATCKVTVTPKNKNFDTIITWGASRSQIKAEMPPHLDIMVDENQQLLYTLPEEQFPWYGFSFKDGGLNGSSIYVTDELYYNYNAQEYIDERYALIESDYFDGHLYANAYNLRDASIALSVFSDENINNEKLKIMVCEPVYHLKSSIAREMLKMKKDKYKKINKRK
ncbi:MAG: Ig-like domain-containing protein [Muribaculaceae bacterium]|nr:Ig-like domain-containing protein [Muribaculaceae bacterium]